MYVLAVEIERVPENPCIPSPCGPNSQCREINGQGVCSCLPNYIGSPPSCRPECVVSSECPQDKACQNQKCVNPCPGPCGLNSRCNVNNHSPICSCNRGYTGDPFSRCYPIPRKCKNVDLNDMITIYYILIFQPQALRSKKTPIVTHVFLPLAVLIRNVEI